LHTPDKMVALIIYLMTWSLTRPVGPCKTHFTDNSPIIYIYEYIIYTYSEVSGKAMKCALKLTTRPVGQYWIFLYFMHFCACILNNHHAYWLISLKRRIARCRLHVQEESTFAPVGIEGANGYNARNTRPKSFHSKMGTTHFGDLLYILLMAILLPSYFGEKHTPPPNEPKYKLIWLRPRRPWHQIVYKMWRVIESSTTII